MKTALSKWMVRVVLGLSILVIGVAIPVYASTCADCSTRSLGDLNCQCAGSCTGSLSCSLCCKRQGEHTLSYGVAGAESKRIAMDRCKTDCGIHCTTNRCS